MLWYCYKRGREERLKKESSEAGPAVVKEGTESRLSIEEVREGESSQAGPSTLPAVNPVPTITEPEDEAAKAVAAAGSSQARS